MADRDEIRFGLRPTLIIGLGGTGHEVLVRLKARYLDAYGEDIFRIIKLLSFDTAEEAKDATREGGELVQMDRGTELIHIGNVPTTRILKNLDIHPTIKAWLPSNMPARAITAGAMQVRPMGRLALFNHFQSQVRSNLELAIRALSNIKQRGDIGDQGTIARTQGINIFIITSVCGGTGSGIFIDMAYVLRQLCMDQGLDENYCYLNGILVLPQAFATVTGDAIRANAYAALLELDYFSKGGNFSAEYPGGTLVSSHIRPFNICYLVDAVNERGKMLAGLNELSPMIAEAVFLQTASQVGDTQKSVFDNVKALDGLDQDYPTAYSGFGTASLVFPAEVLIDACASRYCNNLLKSSLIGRAVNPEMLTAEINAVTDKMRLTQDVLKVEMGKDENGRTMRVRLDPRQLDKVPNQELVKTAVSRMQREEDRNLNDVYQRNMENNLKRLRDEMSQALNADIDRIVNDSDLGLDLAIAFLDALDRHITELVDSFSEQRQAADKQARQLETRNTRLHEDLVNATGSFVLGRGGRINKARDAYINHHRTRMTTLLNKNLHSLTLTLLAHISDDVVRERLRELETLRDKFQVAQERLSTLAAELADGKSRALSPLTYEITDAQDVNRYYDQFVRDLTQELPRMFEEYGQLHTWAARSYEEVHDTLLNFGRSVFAAIRQINVEQVIMEKRDQETPEVRLEMLRDDSIPFWNRDLTRMSDGGTFLETLAVIGVPDRDNTIYTEVRSGEVAASTHNRHAVTVLTTRHGLTVYALQQFDDYQRRYERHRERQVSPLHCFDVLNMRRMKTVFALGQACGYIIREGNRFFLYPPAERETLQEKIELGMGLRKALDRFLSVAQYPKQIETLTDKHMAEKGGEHTWKIVEDYINSPLSSSLNLRALEQELKRLALDYQKEYLPPPSAKKNGD